MDRKYFYSFTQSERRGFVVLVVLLLLMAVLLFVKPFVGADMVGEENFSAFADSVELYGLHIVADSIGGDKVGSYEKRHRVRRLKPFIFDPNTLDKEGWVAMGFSEKQAQAVVNYRKKRSTLRQKGRYKKDFLCGRGGVYAAGRLCVYSSKGGNKN